MFRHRMDREQRRCFNPGWCLVLLAGLASNAVAQTGPSAAESCETMGRPRITVSYDSVNDKTVGVLDAVPMSPGVSLSLLVVTEGRGSDGPDAVALLLREQRPSRSVEPEEHIAFRVDDRPIHVAGRLYPIADRSDEWSLQTAMIPMLLWNEVLHGRTVQLIANGREYPICEELKQGFRALLDAVLRHREDRPGVEG